MAAEWKAPLPPPSAVAQYEQIIPGGAERIMRMAEQALSHHTTTETTALNANISDARRGHWLGAGISALAIVCATANSLMGGHWVVSVALVGVPIFAVIKAIIDSRSHPGK